VALESHAFSKFLYFFTQTKLCHLVHPKRLSFVLNADWLNSVWILNRRTQTLSRLAAQATADSKLIKLLIKFKKNGQSQKWSNSKMVENGQIQTMVKNGQYAIFPSNACAILI